MERRPIVRTEWNGITGRGIGGRGIGGRGIGGRGDVAGSVSACTRTRMRYSLRRPPLYLVAVARAVRYALLAYRLLLLPTYRTKHNTRIY